MYRARLIGPLLNWIDMHVEVPAVTARELLRTSRGGANSSNADDDSVTIRHRVEAARAIQQRRFEDRPCVRTNADMSLAELDAFCRLDLESTALLQKVVESLSRGARAAHRSLRVARTIADLAGSRVIQLEHVAEAVQYQASDRATIA